MVSLENRTQFSTSNWRESFQRKIPRNWASSAGWVSWIPRGLLTLGFMSHWISSSCSLEKKQILVSASLVWLLWRQTRLPSRVSACTWEPACAHMHNKGEGVVGRSRAVSAWVWVSVRTNCTSTNTWMCVSGEASLPRILSLLHPGNCRWPNIQDVTFERISLESSLKEWTPPGCWKWNCLWKRHFSHNSLGRYDNEMNYTCLEKIGLSLALGSFSNNEDIFHPDCFCS